MRTLQPPCERYARGLLLVTRVVLFALILTLGTTSALVAGETRGLALASLSGVSVQAVAGTGGGKVLYAGMTGGPQPAGVYRSEDYGLTWTVVSSGPGSAINALAVHPFQPDVVYAGTAGGAFETAASLWRSDNGGQTWHRFSVNLPADAYGNVPAVTALAIDPVHPDALYVATNGQGVYRFDVQRNSFQMVGGLSLYNAHVRSLVLAPDGRLYALTNEGAFFSDGSAWQPLQNVPELPVSLAVAADNPRVLYAGGASTGVYRSLDGGQTWTLAVGGVAILPGAALRVTALAVDPNNQAHVVAASALGLGNRLVGDAIYDSRNSGDTWQKVAGAQGVVAQLTIEQGVIYAGSSSGLARYGELTPRAGQVFGRPNWAALANPTGIQVLILVLTLTLAGLALTWRREWLVRRRGAAS